MSYKMHLLANANGDPHGLTYCGKRHMKTTVLPALITCLSCKRSYEGRKHIPTVRINVDTTAAQGFIDGIHRAMRHVFRKLDVCANCEGPIETMCFQGTGVCSENCRKDLARDNAV